MLSSGANGSYAARDRTYDPTTARWSGVDPVRPPLNLNYDSTYSYVGNQPGTGIDPLGDCNEAKVWCQSAHMLRGELHGLGDMAVNTVRHVAHQAIDPTYTARQLAQACTDGYAAEHGDIEGVAQCLDNTNPIADIRRSFAESYRLAALGCFDKAGRAVTPAVVGTVAVVGGVRIPLASARVTAAVARSQGGGVVFRSDTSHVFRDAKGHLAEDTPANRALLEGAVQPGNHVGTRGPGGAVDLYRQLLPGGRQVWVEVRNGTEITNGGVNDVPRP